jgi:hypothetical protein
MLDHDLQHMDYDFEYLGGLKHHSDQLPLFHTPADNYNVHTEEGSIDQENQELIIIVRFFVN